METAREPHRPGGRRTEERSSTRASLRVVPPGMYGRSAPTGESMFPSSRRAASTRIPFFGQAPSRVENSARTHWQFQMKGLNVTRRSVALLAGLGLVFAVLGTVPARSQTPDTVVQTESGLVQGFTDGSTKTWAGVPYGAPPVGDRHLHRGQREGRSERVPAGRRTSNR